MSEQEQKELDHIARVFEKFLYGKLLKQEGVRAEGLRVVWIDGDSTQEPVEQLQGSAP